MTRTLVAMVGAVLAVLVAVGSQALSFGKSNTAALTNATVSTTGVPVSATGQAAQLIDTVLDGEAPGNVNRLTTSGTRSFYRLQADTGSVCYAAGPASDQPEVTELTIALCPREPAFPSVDMPVLDLSTFTVDKGSSKGFLSRVEGFVADGVNSIDLIAFDGSKVKTIPVISNIYHLEGTDPTVVGIIARDAMGREVARK